jgi:EAL domain-containing protein (putative c-di-GMP-specific phosphodiesterase class I)
MDQSPRLDALSLLRALAAGDADPGPDPAHAARTRLRFSIAQALARGRMRFHFQPVVRADAPGFVAFHEMLARLVEVDGRVLPASAFIGHAEDNALGRVIDRLALETALDELAAEPGLRLSINLSPRSMGDSDWLGVLTDGAERLGRRVTGRLILEITESEAIAASGQTQDFMDHVRGYGCAFALDDFGAGATGFRHFRDFRFDMVKLDGGFVEGVARSRDSQALVGCLMSAARHFEMMVVAERVESPADAAWLVEAGVDCLQGYLYGRPSVRPIRPEAPRRDARAG